MVAPWSGWVDSLSYLKVLCLSFFLLFFSFCFSFLFLSFFFSFCFLVIVLAVAVVRVPGGRL